MDTVYIIIYIYKAAFCQSVCLYPHTQVDKPTQMDKHAQVDKHKQVIEHTQVDEFTGETPVTVFSGCGCGWGRLAEPPPTNQSQDLERGTDTNCTLLTTWRTLIWYM